MTVKILKPPQYDAYIYLGQAYYIPMAQLEMLVGRSMNKTYRAFIQFDISKIPYNANISSAVMKLYLFKNDFPGVEKNLGVFQLVSYWHEKTVTWWNQPNFVEPPVYSITLTNEQDVFLEFDLTDLAQKWMRGEAVNQGVMLKMADEATDNLIGFRTKEFKNSLYWPALEVIFQEEVDIYVPSFEVNQIEDLEAGADWDYSLAREVLALEYSYVVKNTGPGDALVVIEYSPDGVEWVRDNDTVMVPAGEARVLPPLVLSRYVRVAYKATNPVNPGSLTLYLQGRR